MHSNGVRLVSTSLLAALIGKSNSGKCMEVSELSLSYCIIHTGLMVISR